MMIMWHTSSFLLIDILRLCEIFNILLECLIITAGLFDELSILGSSLLQIFDLLVQLDERIQFWDLCNFVPDLFSLALFLEVSLFSVCFARHRIIYNLYIEWTVPHNHIEIYHHHITSHHHIILSFALLGYLWSIIFYLCNHIKSINS